MASVDTQTLHSGHTINVRVNGVVIGRATGLDGEHSFGTEGAYEIGSIMPFEHAPLRYEGSFSIERYLLRQEDMVKAGLTSLGEDVLTKGILSFEVVDKFTNNTVRVYRGCTQVNGREAFRANGFAQENATFTYLSKDKGIGQNQDPGTGDAGTGGTTTA